MEDMIRFKRAMRVFVFHSALGSRNNDSCDWYVGLSGVSLRHPSLQRFTIDSSSSGYHAVFLFASRIHQFGLLGVSLCSQLHMYDDHHRFDGRCPMPTLGQTRCCSLAQACVGNTLSLVYPNFESSLPLSQNFGIS